MGAVAIIMGGERLASPMDTCRIVQWFGERYGFSDIVEGRHIASIEIPRTCGQGNPEQDVAYGNLLSRAGVRPSSEHYTLDRCMNIGNVLLLHRYIGLKRRAGAAAGGRPS